MFEKYTTEARRTIFFARYEASVFGEREIDTEHLLLGILRENRVLADRLLQFNLNEKTIRARIGKDRPVQEYVATSVDLPVSRSLKRAMSNAAEEGTLLGVGYIGPEHLLLGIAREESCLAAVILREARLGLPRLRELVGTAPPSPEPTPTEPAQTAPVIPSQFVRDLTGAARAEGLSPLIGREIELGRIMQILSRRGKNNAVLIGDPGVGKTAILEGLATHLAAGGISGFSNHRVYLMDANSLVERRIRETLKDLAIGPDVLLCVEGLFDLAAAGADWGVVQAMNLLEPLLSTGHLQCLATGTPAGLRHTIESAPTLARHFEVVNVLPPDPAQAVEILNGLKARYEQFHGVSIGPGTTEMALFASGRFLAHRALPDRALDLIDEAAAQVKLRRETEPPEVAAIRKRIRQHARDFENAVATHSRFREFAEAETAERENLRRLLEQRASAAPSISFVTPADIEQAVADRAGVPVSAVRTILLQKGPRELEQTIGEISARIPIDGNEWIALLAAWIVRSSSNEIDALIDAIQAASGKSGSA